MTINVLDPEEFPAILRLLKSTGGKYIIVENGKPSFAMMTISEYEKLLNKKEKTEKCCSGKLLLDKINHDIADWKMKQDEENKKYFDYELPKKSYKKDVLVEEDLSYYYDVEEEQKDERFDF